MRATIHQNTPMDNGKKRRIICVFSVSGCIWPGRGVGVLSISAKEWHSPWTFLLCCLYSRFAAHTSYTFFVPAIVVYKVLITFFSYLYFFPSWSIYMFCGGSVRLSWIFEFSLLIGWNFLVFDRYLWHGSVGIFYHHGYWDTCVYTAFCAGGRSSEHWKGVRGMGYLLGFFCA